MLGYSAEWGVGWGWFYFRRGVHVFKGMGVMSDGQGGGMRRGTGEGAERAWFTGRVMEGVNGWRIRPPFGGCRGIHNFQPDVTDGCGRV